MSSVVVVGTQWGDEGKGKITDFLIGKCRSNRTIPRRKQRRTYDRKFNGVTYKLHLIPSGIFYKDKICVIGNGMVVDPKAL
jgi:adenylosuccinate synthase